MYVVHRLIGVSAIEGDVWAALDGRVKDQIADIIKVLASNKLYAPNLNFEEKSVDNELSSWLHAMLTSETQNKKEKVNGLVFAKDTNKNQKNAYLQLPVLESRYNTHSTLPCKAAHATAHSTEARVNQILDHLEDWDFSVFELAELTNGKHHFFF